MKFSKQPWYWQTYKVILFYTFLSSARACMTLGDNQYVDMVLSLFVLLTVPPSRYRFTDVKIYAALMLMAAAAWTMHGAVSIPAYFAQIFMVLIPVQLLMFKPQYRIELFDTLSKWFSVLLILSIGWWLLYLIGVPLPHTSVELPWQYNDYGCRIDNYFLFNNEINLSPWAPVQDYFRYNGFFLEPGHMGTITAFFLYANRYDMSLRRNWIFLLTVALTLSAAAYVLVALGYIMQRFHKSKLLVISILVWFGVILIAAALYNGGDNVVNELIIGKLTRDSGALEGRIAEWTAQLWEKSVRRGDITFGLGAGALAQMTQSSGYKVYILQNGLFGVALTLIAYWLIQRTCVSRLGKLMFVLYVVSFLQRTYCFWDAFLDTYILGIAYLKFAQPTSKHNLRSKKLVTKTGRNESAVTET